MNDALDTRVVLPMQEACTALAALALAVGAYSSSPCIIIIIIA
jgi:hypothetical protein